LVLFAGFGAFAVFAVFAVSAIFVVLADCAVGAGMGAGSDTLEAGACLLRHRKAGVSLYMRQASSSSSASSKKDGSLRPRGGLWSAVRLTVADRFDACLYAA
jgi:hypothetical protein